MISQTLTTLILLTGPTVILILLVIACTLFCKITLIDLLDVKTVVISFVAGTTSIFMSICGLPRDIVIVINIVILLIYDFVMLILLYEYRNKRRKNNK